MATKIQAKLHRCKSTKTTRPTRTSLKHSCENPRGLTDTHAEGGAFGAGPPGSRLGQGSEGRGTPKMAASMCDVFSFCVGVAGPARIAVEVRFVSSAKVRPRRIVPGFPTQPVLGNSPAGPYACSLEGPLPLGLCYPAPGAPCRYPRAGFQGDHAVAWGPRSLRALPLLPWNRAFLLAGLGSARPGDIPAGS